MPQGWKVVDQKFVPGGVNVEYQTDDGIIRSIYVAAGNYNTAGVKAVITDEVATREQVGNLTSEG